MTPARVSKSLFSCGFRWRKTAAAIIFATLLPGCGFSRFGWLRRGPMVDRPSVVSRFSPPSAAASSGPRQVDLAIHNDAQRISAPMLDQFAARLSTEMQLSVPNAAVDWVTPVGYNHLWPSDQDGVELSHAVALTPEGPPLLPEAGVIPPPPSTVTPEPQRERLVITVVDFRPYQPMRMSLRLTLYHEPDHAEIASANAVWEALPDEHHPGGPWRQRLRQRLFDQARDPERHLQAISPNEFFRRVSQEIAMWYASSGAQAPIIAGDSNSVVIESSWSAPGVPGPLP